MANKYNVTRTINTTTVTALTINPETMETTTKVFTYDGVEKEDKVKILKYLRKRNETETCSLVSIVKIETTEQLYGMTEEDFIKYSKVLNPVTRKPVDEN